ncbi:MAG: hypothetical protein PF487_12500 [Bacteroidales bacterium]|jgi:hypothetical protein|nr:hypothetical protein [Bacteroidales bacterium]
MKEGTKYIILIIGMIISIGLIIWGNIIIRNYDGYLEIFKAARRAAAPQLYGGIILMVGCYLLTLTFKLHK